MCYLSEERVIKMIKEIVLGIQYLHKNHIVHRDIKPGNVFLMDDEEETIKLGDLGIAKDINDSKQVMLTKLGTPYYMAPEIELMGKYTKSADIYSLGCVAFALCALKIPFTA